MAANALELALLDHLVKLLNIQHAISLGQKGQLSFDDLQPALKNTSRLSFINSNK